MDDFDIFDDNSMLGSDNNNSFGTDNSFDNSGFNTNGIQQNNGFQQSNVDNSQFDNGSMQLQDGQSQNNPFDGQFDDDGDNSSNEVADTKKKGIIAVAVGIIGIIVVVGIATLVLGKKDNSGNSGTGANNYQAEQGTNRDVNNIVGTGNNNQQAQQQVQQPLQTQTTVVAQQVQDNNDGWVELSSDEAGKISFNENMTSITFTITGIKHYARSVDVNNNLVIKTTLTGSLSGLSGTYTLDIPYDIGVQLKIGDMFTVNVKLGEYQGKVVVGDIKY